MHFPCKVFLLWSILCKSKPRGPKINASNSQSDYSIIMFALRWEGGGGSIKMQTYVNRDRGRGVGVSHPCQRLHINFFN